MISISCDVHSRGAESMAQNEPMVWPSEEVNGTPAYATTPSSSIAGFAWSTASFLALEMISGSLVATTYRQNECDSGVSRDVAHGSGNPT